MPIRDHDHELPEPDEYPEPDTTDLRCRRCGVALAEDEDHCPACGRAVAAGRSWWMLAVTLLCLAMSIAWALGW